MIDRCHSLLVLEEEREDGGRLEVAAALVFRRRADEQLRLEQDLDDLDEDLLDGGQGRSRGVKVNVGGGRK